MTQRFTFVPAVALAVLAATSACSTSERQPQPAGATADSQHTADVQLADVSDDDFCRALRQAGITNTATLGEPSDPAALLANLDALAAEAPADISTDFAAFDRLEHALLDPATADSTAPRTANGPETRSALTHVAAYLRDTCRITQ